MLAALKGSGLVQSAVIARDPLMSGSGSRQLLVTAVLMVPYITHARCVIPSQLVVFIGRYSHYTTSLVS